MISLYTLPYLNNNLHGLHFLDDLTFRVNSGEDELMCTHSPISTNVRLRAGVRAGNFVNLGDVESMHMCTALCCAKPTCDLAFMIGETCVAVECASEEMCQTIRARPTGFNPKISFIRRREINQNVKKGILHLHMTSFQVIGCHLGWSYRLL